MKAPARCALVIAALALVIGTAGPARGAVLWTLTASPLSVSTGVRTTFSLRASMTLPGDIRCVDVGVPDNFTVHAAAVVGSNAGNSWISEVYGNDVWVRTPSGGDRLRLLGHYVDFTITATAWSSGSLAWGSHAHAQGDCSGAESLLSVPPVVLVIGPAVTPAPLPTVAPTPVPTPTPTPQPTATPRPTLLPSLGPLPSLEPIPSIGLPSGSSTPRPSSVLPEASPQQSEASSRPSVDLQPSGAPSSPQPSDGSSPSIGPQGSPSPSEGTAPQSGGGAGPPDGAPRSVDGRLFAEPAGGPDAAPVPVALGALGILASIDLWIVPGLLLGVPGLLVVAFVALQAVGALAWIPAIRRLRGHQAVATR